MRFHLSKAGHHSGNEVRKEIFEISYGRAELVAVNNPTDISYGNIQPRRISVSGSSWKQWLKKQVQYFEQGGTTYADVIILKRAEQ